jgi:hypothetical protein
VSEDLESVRHPALRWMWWHRLLAVGRTRRIIDADIAVTYYRSRKGSMVVLESEPVTGEAGRLWGR